MGKIRKALVAGAGVAGATALASLRADMPTSAEGWAALVAGALVAGALAGWAVYRVPNDPANPYAIGRPGRGA